MIKGYLMRYSDLIIEYRKGVARRPHDLSSSTHIGAKTKVRSSAAHIRQRPT